MAISVHPDLSGVPRRIGQLEAICGRIAARSDVKLWTSAQILDWYRGQTCATAELAQAVEITPIFSRQVGPERHARPCLFR